MTYLRYSSDIETIEADEQESIDGIIDGMTQESETVAKRNGHAVRASHAKSTACLVGELIVADDLAPELAQGLFARPGTYPVAVRFAQGPGERLSDRVSTHRGMAVKIFDVEGDRLSGHDAPTQDFVLASGPTFPAGTAAGFLSQAKKIGLTVPLPEGAKSAAAAVARTFNRVLTTVELPSSPTADFYGHPFSHPLSEPYFSQCPIRFGDHVAKLGAFPASPAQDDLKDWRLDPHDDDDGFRHATTAFFEGEDAIFELRAQLWTDAATQPIEDASVEWPERDSPYRTVATLRLPRQFAYGEARVRFFDEIMTFRPGHSLVEHRPLGSVMRARLQVYEALSRYRHRRNGASARDVAAVTEIPG
jgi:hypothetical protein